MREPFPSEEVKKAVWKNWSKEQKKKQYAYEFVIAMIGLASAAAMFYLGYWLGQIWN